MALDISQRIRKTFPTLSKGQKRIANAVLYLCSDMAGFITGENICIDGGMTKQMIYHGDCGWTLAE